MHGKGELVFRAKPLILCVEDNIDYLKEWERELDNYQLIIETNIRSATSAFCAHKRELSGIIVDAHVPGEVFNTRELVRFMRGRFSKPIIGAYGPITHAWLLDNAGCTHVVRKSLISSQIGQIVYF